MFGEGDIMRHLASNGYRLTYEQDPRAEFNFGVTNLALDLRNGMRLCKLIELLSGTSATLSQLTHRKSFPCLCVCIHSTMLKC